MTRASVAAALVETDAAVVAVSLDIESASEDCTDVAVAAAASIRACITAVLAARVEVTAASTDAMVAERDSSLVSTCCWSSWTLTS